MEAALSEITEETKFQYRKRYKARSIKKQTIYNNKGTGKKPFTKAERKLLKGLSRKIAGKHGCSSTYVRHIINGQRNTHSLLARCIVEDLRAFLALLRPGA